MAQEPETHAKKSSSSGMFPHFMLKEIYEQPQAIQETIQRHADGPFIFASQLISIESALLTFKKIIIAASGSSRHAGLVGEIMIEDLSGVAVDVEYASEYCYRSTHAGADPIVLVITQSGETADTIAAQREALTRGAKTVAITNVADSTIAREASASLPTYATPEVAIPATKSFTAQLTVLYLLALFLARKRGRMTSEVVRTHLERLLELPGALQRSLALWDSQARECARRYRQAQGFLYLGRGVHYAIAREGALKLKEVSYAHAEGYPTGELKHGPNALVSEQGLVVILATCDHSDPDSVLRYRKTLGILEDVKGHGGNIFVVATEGDSEVRSFADHAIFVPPAPELLLPILEAVPLQLFAYHSAVLNGCDVDCPRNLVKAVTRE
jgi:glucosamine--fructose-6-phosphate aminotransferase (isomerizing)